MHHFSLGTVSVRGPDSSLTLLALRIELFPLFLYGFLCPLASGPLYRGHRALTVFQSGLGRQLSSVVPASISALKQNWKDAGVASPTTASWTGPGRCHWVGNVESPWESLASFWQLERRKNRTVDDLRGISEPSGYQGMTGPHLGK